MVDFFKVKVPNSYKRTLLTSPKLEFVNPHVRMLHDGTIEEVTNKKKKFISRECEYKELTIVIYFNGTIYLFGSMQMFFFGGINHRDYTLADLTSTIDQIQSDLEIPLALCKLQKIEFTVNLHNLPMTSTKIIKGLIATKVIGSRYVYPFKDLKLQTDGTIKTSERTTVTHKIYDKMRHAKLAYEQLRYEIVIRTNRQILKDTGARKITDLSNTKVIDNVKQMMLKRWTEVILFDFDVVSNDDNYKYCTFAYWESIASSKTKLYRQRQRLTRRSKEKGSNIHELITQAIIKKWDKLYTGSP